MQKYPHKCPKNKKMPWYFVLHNEIPRFYALNFNQYPKSVVYPKSYYELKTSKRHLIKAERPQEVIYKIITRPNDRFGFILFLVSCSPDTRAVSFPHTFGNACGNCFYRQYPPFYAPLR